MRAERTAPSELLVRAYNVGFGDCLLLRFTYPDASRRHVLIDFGTTALPERGGPPSMLAVAEQIRADCGGKLEMVVASHRHADHISGFAGKPGAVIAGLAPELVVQPWTEDPDLAVDATAPATGSQRPARGNRALVARLADMHAVAGLAAAEAPRLAASGSVPRTVSGQLAFLGETNLANLPAVKALQALGPTVFAHHGTELPVRKLLPGVGVDVLGPPTLEQSGAIERQAERDVDEFWHLAARGAAARTPRRARARPGAEGERRPPPLFGRRHRADEVPQQAQWVVPRIDRLRGEELLSIVRTLDDAMNNTSLILLFDVGGTLLLFPGDAQLENWRYALRDAPGAAATCARLAGTRVYKVGHHGSLNATPRTLLWEAFAGKGPQGTPDRLVTVMSTRRGKHGEDSRSTEVPRRTLVAELERLSDHVTTQKATKKGEFWRDVHVPL